MFVFPLVRRYEFDARRQRRSDLSNFLFDPFDHSDRVFAKTNDDDASRNITFTVDSYLQAGVPANKILMGIPFYAYGWAITGPSAQGQNGQFVAAVNPANPSSGNPPNYAGTVAIQLDPALAGVAATETHTFLDLNVLPFSQLFHEPKAQTPYAFDGLNWWSEGAFRLLALGDLWSRLDLGSLIRVENGLQHRLSGVLWRGLMLPILRIPALPTFVIMGVFCLWLGRRIGSRADPALLGGSRPRRRRSRGLS